MLDLSYIKQAHNVIKQVSSLVLNIRKVLFQRDNYANYSYVTQ